MNHYRVGMSKRGEYGWIKSASSIQGPEQDGAIFSLNGEPLKLVNQFKHCLIYWKLYWHNHK